MGLSKKLLKVPFYQPSSAPCLTLREDVAAIAGFQVVLWLKNLPDNAEDEKDTTGSTPGLGRSLGIGNGILLQYSCLENSLDRGASMGSQRVGHDLATNTRKRPAPAEIRFSSYYLKNFFLYLAVLGPSCGTWDHLLVAYSKFSGGM